MTDSRARWDRFFIEMAAMVATKSKDPSTKVGCVLVGKDNQVLSIGYNGFPRGVMGDDDPNGPRWERPTKYEYIEHAERNAIFNAARSGISVLGARAYMNWEPTPCADCTRALIQAGVCEIIGPDIPFGGVGAGVHYHVDQESAAVNMLREAGVTRTPVPVRLRVN